MGGVKLAGSPVDDVSNSEGIEGGKHLRFEEKNSR